jgi:hypothetical protein
MAYVGASPGLVLRGRPVALLSVGPGLVDEHSVPQAFIFDAGQSWGAVNPLQRFYAEDAAALDWLDDYMMDSQLRTILRREEEFIIRADEDLEDTYLKDALTNIDADAGWAEG